MLNAGATRTSSFIYSLSLQCLRLLISVNTIVLLVAEHGLGLIISIGGATSSACTSSLTIKISSFEWEEQRSSNPIFFETSEWSLYTGFSPLSRGVSQCSSTVSELRVAQFLYPGLSSWRCFVRRTRSVLFQSHPAFPSTCPSGWWYIQEWVRVGLEHRLVKVVVLRSSAPS